jgi:hypothetical protein
MDHELPTPHSMARTAFRLLVWCKSCRHQAHADLAALITSGRGDVPLIHLRFRCGNCGSRLTDSVVSGSHWNGRSAEPGLPAAERCKASGRAAAPAAASPATAL